MRNDGQKPQGGVSRPGRNNGLIPNSLRTLSRIVYSGASSVASTVKSAASAAFATVDRDSDASPDQVHWAGFDKLECKRGITRQVLLLGYWFGFQIWDVEEADNVYDLVSRHDGPVSFMQILPNPPMPEQSVDKFADSRPLLAICADGSFLEGGNIHNGLSSPRNASIHNCHDALNGCLVPTVVWFYSLRTQSYVHMLKFRSIVYLIRCSSRIVAVLQSAQIHCFNTATLEREYAILTNPVIASSSGFGGIGFGPLAVGPRWIAYSGSPVALSNSGRVSPQHLTTSASFPASASNGSLVAHYAKESSKQLAAGIVTLGDMGYKRLSRYYSELLPNGNNSQQSGTPAWKVQGIANGHLPDVNNVGMVIVRDIVSKSVIAQFRAHKSPISSLCFDPSGILLVTASIQGHNINVYQIMSGASGSSSGSDSGATSVHLYRLQRGFTNAVVQDISFSDDSHWIMISSSRGTSHLFGMSPFGESVKFQCSGTCFNGKNSASGIVTKHAVYWPPSSGFQMPNEWSFCASCPPVTLSAVTRIRGGNNSWKSTMSVATAAATGRMNSFSGPIASSFHNCKDCDLYTVTDPLKAKHCLLVFSPSGFVFQYTLHVSFGVDSATAGSGLSTSSESASGCDARLVVEAIQKWNVCQKQQRRDREDNIDIYGENGNLDGSKVFPEGMLNNTYTEARHTVSKVTLSPEERHHMYISEAELHTHQPCVPLWAKSEMYFHAMVMDDIKIDEDASEGEVEIEGLPLCMIEARSKDLVPVFEHLQTPRLQPPSFSFVNNNGQLPSQRSVLCENGSTCATGFGGFDSVPADCVAVAECQNVIEQTGCNGFRIPADMSSMAL